MWYRTGTISLTKDSATISGVGTKWAQAANGVLPGMIIIMPDSKFYEIKNVVSDTSLVLSTPYTGATAAAQSYAVVTTYEGDLSQFSARFSALLTALGGSRTDLYNWLTSSASTINISKDDGTTASVKTLKAFSDEQATFAKKGKNTDITELTGLTTALAINQGGTGATDAAGIRKNAGLGTAATRDVGEGDGNVLQRGAFGIGNATSNPRITSHTDITDLMKTLSDVGTCFFRNTGQIPGMSQHSTNMYIRTGDTHSMLNVAYETGVVTAFATNTVKLGNGSVQRNTLYGTMNTTKGADGTLKAASPIVKVFHGGQYETNNEAEGCSVSRIAVGEYLIEGCLGMNADASWGGINGGFDIPKDRNGQPLIWLDFRVNADGSILVKTYHRTYPNSPVFAQNSIEGLKDGDPVDIPADQFVLVRVQMLLDSEWNQRVSP